MIDLKPRPDTLRARVGRYLDATRAVRNDSEALDALSLREIHVASFEPLREARDAMGSNFLVPLEVSRSKAYQAWRYAPFMRVLLPILTPAKSLGVKIEFSVPCWYEYFEQGAKNEVTRRSLPSPGPPLDFFKIESDEHWSGVLQQASLLARNNRSLRPLSARLLHFVWETRWQEGERIEEDLRVHGSDTTVKTFPATSGGAASERKPAKGSGRIRMSSEEVVLHVSIGLTSRQGEHDQLFIEVTNVTPANPGPQTRSADWMRQAAVFPTLELGLDPPQPYPSQEDAHLRPEALREDLREAYLAAIQDDAPRVINGIATFLSSPCQRLVAGMTGIHDTVRLEPVAGPALSALSDPTRLLVEATELSADARTRLRESGKLEATARLFTVLSRAFPDVTHLHRFQWIALQRQLNQLLDGTVRGKCHLVKAPTGTGKTLVFMTAALLHYLWTKERVALTFPTRILNEDMYRRLTLIVSRARDEFPDADITAGILIGTRDPLYEAISRPQAGQRMVQFDLCPKCGSRGSVYGELAGPRVVGVCRNPGCKLRLDYMFGSLESVDFLPSITIATPDKLFFEATARSGPEAVAMRFFGGRFRPCRNCGAKSPDWWEYKDRCLKCNSEDLGAPARSPVLFWIFDEVHSLHGLTGVYLSTFLAGLQTYWKRVNNQETPDLGASMPFGYMVGTATIANEFELLTELTRVSEASKNLIVTPEDAQFYSSFSPMPSQTRYRILVTIPLATNVATLALRLMLYTRKSLAPGSSLETKLSELLGLPADKSPYGLSLTYVQRKNVGYELVREYSHKTQPELGFQEAIPFISGDTPNRLLVEYFNRASLGQLHNFVANVVISLGLDIEDLNHMFVVSVPESMIEFVQTIGRTGRRSPVPGHCQLVLRPDYPRDLEVYRNFHYVMGDFRGYFEAQPLRRANLYAARRIFANVLRLVLAAHSEDDRKWMLSANKAAERLLNRAQLRAQVIRDVADVLGGAQNPELESYQRLANDELTTLLKSWSRLVGGGNYLGSVLGADQRLLLTLRESDERDVLVHNLDPLAGQLQQVHHEALGVDDLSGERGAEDDPKP